MRTLIKQKDILDTTVDRLTEDEITTKLESLQANMEKFQNVQDKIDENTEDEDMDEQVQHRIDVDQLCQDMKSKLKTAWRKILAQGPSILPAPATPVQQNRTPKMNFRPFEDSETIRNFMKRLSVYMLMNDVTDPKMKVYTLLSALPPELHEQLQNLCSPDDPISKDFAELTTILENFIDPKPSAWASQHTFINRLQETHETVAQYASELKKLSLNCEFKCEHFTKPNLESFLALQLIRGLRDDEIRIKILQERSVKPFEQLVEFASAMEMGKTENRTIASKGHSSEVGKEVHKVSERYKNRQDFTSKEKASTSTPFAELQGKCFRCGDEKHRARDCWAMETTCRKCDKKGHLAKVCQQKIKKISQIESRSGSSSESEAEINLLKSKMTDKYMISVQVEGKTVKMEFDTGASLSAISLKDFKKINLGKKMFKTDMKFKTYTGEVFRASGVVFVKCTYKGQDFFGKLYVIDKKVDPIFGRDWMKELNVNLADLRTLETVSHPPKLDELLEQYASTVFSPDLGEIPNVRGHLALKENSQPVFIKPRRIPYALKPKVDEEIDRLCKQGVLTKVDHSEWGTPVVPIVKPNGSIRLCADYKVTLNKVIKDEQYPIPIIEDILSEMKGAKFFCTLDLTQAYLNMVMDEESVIMQTLSTHKGTFKVNRLMFGVKVAPSLWQKFMDQLLQGLDGVKCFFDDIIIQGSSEDELLRRLEQVLQRLKENNLRVNREKCQFFKKSINYLGHTIDEEGIHKNKDKVTAITNAERPTNVSELRTFLGMANYYNKFIPNLACITSPLNQLLKKGVKFHWSEQCEQSFKRIKQEILSERVLIYFDPSKPVILATDASPTGLGAVLSHRMEDGSERPIAFASRSLSSSEKKYSQIDKEATAIFWGLKKFFHYCYGRKFTLITDHRPLTSIFHPHKTLPAFSAMRLFHYAHYLSGFDYDIEYRNTKLHGNADYLSRFPVESVKDKKMDQHALYQLSQINVLQVSPDIIAEQTQADPQMKPIVEALETGRSLKNYGFQDNELTLQDKCILRGTRVMIPMNLREQILNELHKGHLGILKMKLLARSYVYWKNLDKEIEDKVKSCKTCRLQQNEPAHDTLHHWEEPAGPWQRIHVDFAGPIA